VARLLLLVPTTSYRIADFMAAATRSGIEVVVGSNRKLALDALSGGATLAVDLRDTDRGLTQILAYAARRPLSAIVGIDDETTVLAARAAEALGLPHNDPGAVAASGDKFAMRTRLAAAGLPSPRFRRFSPDDNPATAAREASYPCVLKPVALAASRGVIRADDADAFVAAFRRIVAILDDADVTALGATARHILVEDYIPGREVALEGLLMGGALEVLALFDKPDPLEGPFFEETIYVTPSRLAPPVRARIAEATARAVAALGLREGPVHAELRVTDDGVRVIEVAARSIGGLCSRVLEFGAGLSLEDVILRHALRRNDLVTERAATPAGVMMIPIPAAGVLRGVEGLAAARAVPGIADLRITIPKGQRVVPLPEGNRYLGFLFARGESPAEVEATLRTAHAALRFSIEPESVSDDGARGAQATNGAPGLHSRSATAP